MLASTSVLALCAFIPNTIAFVPQGLTFKRETNIVLNELRDSLSLSGVGYRGIDGMPLAERAAPGSRMETAEMKLAKRRLRELDSVKVQGGSLKTWSFSSPSIERVQVMLDTEGRPLNADVDLWQGPNNSPCKISVYLEDGNERPFDCVIETPRGQNSIAIRNTAALEFPLNARVESERMAMRGSSLETLTLTLEEQGIPEIIQGGAIRTYSFNPNIGSVKVLLKTDGRPLNARVELLQGPNNNKQVMEIYCEDGMERPFFAVMETPGSGNVVRIINTATVEFPMTARVEPHLMQEFSGYEPVITGGF